jgi:ubiquinone/menaquinone biosynthesis C-methylase UbiE
MTWKFDASIAETFVDHARHHIPNYDIVIDKNVSACQKLLNKDSAIIDVGCATGETLRRLHSAGFNNLTGVESSHAMLNHCDSSIAKILHSDQFPEQTFNGVLCNWTLHFIKDKEMYLADIYRNLSDGGFLILSEKTSLDPTLIEFYHDFKSSMGVSAEEIAAKAASVRDIMYINTPKWYLETLDNLGFKNIQIVDASWCFTTFFCIK